MFALFSHNNHCVKNTADSSEWCFDVTYMHEQCIANKFKPETVLLLTYNVGHSVLIWIALKKLITEILIRVSYALRHKTRTYCNVVYENGNKAFYKR